MALTVAKPFTTPLRRFRVGDEIGARDVDGPHSAEQWIADGFLTRPVAKKMPTIAAPVVVPPADPAPDKTSA